MSLKKKRYSIAYDLMCKKGWTEDSTSLGINGQGLKCALDPISESRSLCTNVNSKNDWTTTTLDPFEKVLAKHCEAGEIAESSSGGRSSRFAKRGRHNAIQVTQDSKTHTCE